MLVINSAEPVLTVILYYRGCGYGLPRLLKEAEKCDLCGPRKSVLILANPQYYEIEGTIEFLPQPSPLPGVYAIPEPDQLLPIDVKGDGSVSLFVWRFTPSYRPTLPQP